MIITRVVTEATVVLTLEGRLDSAWSEPTAVALDDAIRLGRARVELDLSAVTFISSLGSNGHDPTATAHKCALKTIAAAQRVHD